MSILSHLFLVVVNFNDRDKIDAEENDTKKKKFEIKLKSKPNVRSENNIFVF